MKTGWVLTEDDKIKLAMRRTTSSPGGGGQMDGGQRDGGQMDAGQMDGGHFINIKKVIIVNLLSPILFGKSKCYYFYSFLFYHYNL